MLKFQILCETTQTTKKQVKTLPSAYNLVSELFPTYLKKSISPPTWSFRCAAALGSPRWMENKQFQSKPIGLVGKKKRIKKGQILTRFSGWCFFTTHLKKMQPSNWIISGPGWKQKIDKNHHQIKIYNSQNPTKHKKRSRFLRFFSSKSKVLVSANLEYFTSLVMLVISSWVGK